MPKVTRKAAPDRDAFVARLKLCEARVGSQNALARKAGITQSTIRRYTARSTEPPRDILVRLAKAAGVSVLWLSTGEGPRDLEGNEAPQDVGTSVADEGLKGIAAAAAEKFSVPFEFALSRLMGSDEMRAVETAMKEWSRYSPIPVAGTDKQEIWGVLSQADLEKASPGSLLKDIEVHQVRTNRLAPHFLKGDWALVDTSQRDADGHYCVIPAHSSEVEIREFTTVNGERKISGPDKPEKFMSEDGQGMSFVVIGRIVGAIRFVRTDRGDGR